jgi:membrane protein YqaA with SNARE-associated domain
MKLNDFWIELRQAFPTKRVDLIKMILFFIGILLAAVGLSIVLIRFVPEDFLEGLGNYGYLGVFLICFLSSLTVIFPFPGTVIWVALVLPPFNLNPALTAITASIGGSLGEISAYYVGQGGRTAISSRYTQAYDTAQRWIKKYGAWTIIAFAFFPFLIFDLAGIAAGVFRYPVSKFLLFCWVGRLPRSFIECYVYYYTGKTIIKFILPYLPSWLSGLPVG